MSQTLTWSGFPALSFHLRTERAEGSGEEKGNYAQWVDSKLSIFHKKAVGFPRDIHGQKPGFSHKMYFQPQGGGRMRWLGLLRQQPFLKNHFKIKLNAIKLAKVPGEPGKRVTQINGPGWATLNHGDVRCWGWNWGSKGPRFSASESYPESRLPREFLQKHRAGHTPLQRIWLCRSARSRALSLRKSLRR